MITLSPPIPATYAWRNSEKERYALERASWGRGLATEAARAALAYGFDEAGLPRIVAVTRPEHTRSRHVLEKLGMRYERDVDVFGIHAVLYALGRDAFRTPR